MPEVRTSLREDRKLFGFDDEEVSEVRWSSRADGRSARDPVQRVGLVRDRLRREGRGESRRRKFGKRIEERRKVVFGFEGFQAERLEVFRDEVREIQQEKISHDERIPAAKEA